MFRFFFGLLYMVLGFYLFNFKQKNQLFFIVDLKTKWLQSSAEELWKDSKYVAALFEALLSSVGKKPDLVTYENNIHALEFIIMAYSDEVFIRNLSDEHIDERREFFTDLCAGGVFWKGNVSCLSKQIRVGTVISFY